MANGEPKKFKLESSIYGELRKRIDKLEEQVNPQRIIRDEEWNVLARVPKEDGFIARIDKLEEQIKIVWDKSFSEDEDFLKRLERLENKWCAPKIPTAEEVKGILKNVKPATEPSVKMTTAELKDMAERYEYELRETFKMKDMRKILDNMKARDRKKLNSNQAKIENADTLASTHLNNVVYNGWFYDVYGILKEYSGYLPDTAIKKIENLQMEKYS